MRKFIVTLVLGFCAVAARADNIIIPFSGSGSSGTISDGIASVVPWTINTGGGNDWGIPDGAGADVFNWPGPGGLVDDLTVTFSGLPTSALIAGGQFHDFITGVDWAESITDGGSTITFTAPAGDPLGAGDPFFAHVGFLGPEGSSVSFTGGWSGAPEPSSVILLLTMLLGVAFAARKRMARA